MYSLVSASVLGYDLARLEGGARLAHVLRRALELGPTDLSRLLVTVPLADERLAAARETAVDAASRQVRVSEALAVGVTGLADATRRRVALGLLGRAAIGDVEALLRLVRTDVFDWTGRREQDLGLRPAWYADAVQVVADAAVAAYTQGVVEPEVGEALTARWLGALPDLPPATKNVGPSGVPVERVLERVADLDADDLLRLEAVADESRGQHDDEAPVDWAHAMHAATWAVHLAGRVRPAAAAQLRLVEAVHGVVAPERLARGVWSTLSGAVQAEVVADLLDAATHASLAGRPLAALGLPAEPGASGSTPSSC